MDQLREELVEIVKQIGDWSRENFGDQSGDGLILDRIAPLLGVVEEGMEAILARSETDIVDAVADILIFLSDYVVRSGFPIDEFVDILITPPKTRSINFTCVAGRMCAAELKRVQGIRNGRDDSWYRGQQRIAISGLVAWCHSMLPLGCKRLVECFRSTWQEVKKRNWREFKKDGVTQ